MLRLLDGYAGTLPVRCALRLAPLVFVRPGELIKAEWAGIDLEGAEWRYTVTKTGTPHIVPLARQAVAILREVHSLTGHGRYVFPNARYPHRERPMSHATLWSTFRALDIPRDRMTLHGFRAMARTILDEVLGFRPDFIEHQLAHAVRDPNGRAYNRTAFLPERRVMMHMRALPHREVAAAIRTARASTVPPAVRLAFEFLVLTAARWGEVRWAEWTEIDRENGVWTVPARRMKSNREHRVPLCGRAVEILDEARKLVGGTSPFLFPNRVGRQLEEKQLRRMFRKHGIAAVPHGFRSSFRDWAAEETDHPREVIEAALAHVVQNRVEAAYRRTDLFERRRRLMGDWAAYLAGAPREPEATTPRGNAAEIR